MSNTVYLTTTLLVTRVVVGDWKKSLVLLIQILEPQDNLLGHPVKNPEM